MKVTEKDEKRFWARVSLPDPETGCMAWRGEARKGYGRFTIDRRRYSAHRISYELLVNSIPEGLQIDHLCRNRACVRPDHLEAVTMQENIRRGVPYRTRKRVEETKKSPKVPVTIANLWDFTSEVGECVLWTRGTSGGEPGNRYGSFYINKVLHYVHREVYRQAHGDIPEGLVIKQMCGNRRCMKLEHLEAMTLSDKRKLSEFVYPDHCAQGHAFAGDNLTYDTNGSRRCLACRREQTARSNRKIRAAKKENV